MIKTKNRQVFVCSDHHFNQESFYQYNEKFGPVIRPEFPNATVADTEIVKRHNEVVPEYGSIVFFLGDVAKNTKGLENIHKMNGEFKILVAGNHDTKFTTSLLLQFFDRIQGAVRLFGRKYLLTHIPVHPRELEWYPDTINIYGHFHRNIINDSRYINACLEPNDYYPIEINEPNWR